MTDEEYDVMLTSPDFRAGKLAHDLGSVVYDLIKLPAEERDLVFDLMVSSNIGLMNLINDQLRWRAKQPRKPDINERLCQVRH